MKKAVFIILPLVIVVLAGVYISRSGRPSSAAAKPSPTPLPAAEQLPPDKRPSVSLIFSSDAHYVTISFTNLNADILEYNLIYDAVVKKNNINTGVSGGGKIAGKSEYSQKQLLGSESSGHFTYHESIKNAVIEITLRDSSNRSVFTSTLPFTVSPGKSLDLKTIQ